MKFRHLLRHAASVRHVSYRGLPSFSLAATASLLLGLAVSQANGQEPLKLLISIESPNVTEPLAARVTLHLHNSGQAPLWLYRHARDPVALREAALSRPESGAEAREYTSGGSSFIVHLEPVGSGNASAGASPASESAHGTVLESVGLPHPKLVKLAPGEDSEEGCVIRLYPAVVSANGKEQPFWGHYRLSVTYKAEYSNAEAVTRDLSVTVWHSEAASNAIDVDLEPPPATAEGSVAGMIGDEEKHPLAGVLVSLSDRQEHLVSQLTTDSSGGFSFDHLPFGLYWVTARREAATVNTAMFEHVDLAATSPAGNIDLLLLPPETYEPKQMLHKPVLFRVTDTAGQPLGDVTLEIVWSSGTVLETVKGETSDDGTAALDLIPGRNYVTLKRRGCGKQDQRVDVAEGDGIDGFQLAFDCSRKR